MRLRGVSGRRHPGKQPIRLDATFGFRACDILPLSPDVKSYSSSNCLQTKSELVMIGLRNLGAVIVLVAPTLAIAATPAPTAAVRAACGADARKFCSAVIRDPEARHKCMVDHHEQDSISC